MKKHIGKMITAIELIKPLNELHIDFGDIYFTQVETSRTQPDLTIFVNDPGNVRKSKHHYETRNGKIYLCH